MLPSLLPSAPGCRGGATVAGLAALLALGSPLTAAAQTEGSGGEVGAAGEVRPNTELAVVDTGPAAPSVDQRRLVAELSGWDPDGQTRPFARSTPEERARAAAFLLETLRSLGLDARLHRYKLPHDHPLADLLVPPFEGANVVAEVPATGADAETVVLGAHYDSQGGPGAVDNATGVTVVIAAAAEVAALERRDRRFLFVLFDQEEDSSEAGSAAFARRLIAEGVDVHSVHNVDLAGMDEDGDRMVRIYAPDDRLADPYREVAVRWRTPLQVTGGGGADAGIDTGSFLRADLPALGVHQGWDEEADVIHTPRDTYEMVDFGYLASMTRLVVGVMERLAVRAAGAWSDR